MKITSNPELGRYIFQIQDGAVLILQMQLQHNNFGFKINNYFGEKASKLILSLQHIIIF
jgi:hypothetical protein